jgi:hypothetical protein
MKIGSNLRAAQSRVRRAIFTVLILAICLAAAGPARAQVVPEGDQDGLSLSAGGVASASTLQLGDRKMLGITAFVDADTHRRIGIEAEGRWLEFHQTANVHAETYSIGGRYHFDVRRFQPYAKGLVGFGDFNYQYNLGTGSYLVITAGGGLDYRLTHRIYIRAADFEYQDWPQFNYGPPNSVGSMTSLGVSTGIRVRIF